MATVIENSSVNSPSIFAVTNSALLTESGPVSPGEIVSIFGTNLGPATAQAASIGPAQAGFPTKLAGVQVLFDGAAAPLLRQSSCSSRTG